MKNCKTWPKYQENWVKTHNYKHKLTLIMVRALTCYPPLSCSNWVKVWVSLHLVVGLCSNGQEKLTTSLSTFSWTSESSNQRCDFGRNGQIWCQVWWFWSQMRSRKDHFDNFWSFICNFIHIRQEMAEKLQTWANGLGELKKILKATLWNLWFDIFAQKIPAIFPIARLCVGRFSKPR